MTTILSAVAIIALLWTTLSALPAGLEARMPLPYMIALTPLLWVPLMILAAVAAWQHEWTAMSLLIVVALIASSQRINYWGTSIDPAGKRKESHRETARETTSPTLSKSHNSNTSGTSNTPKEGPETISDGHCETTRETLSPQFSVMTMNCRYGRADAAEIIRNIRERNISVLALQEVTDDLITRLTEADINELLPYHQFGDAKETDNGGFNVIYSRYEPSAAVPNVVSIPAADVPAITLKTSGARLRGLVGRHFGSARTRPCKIRQQSQYRRRYGRSQLEHRPSELPRVAQVRIQGRKSDSSRRPESHLPELAQVAAHRAGSRAVHSRAQTVRREVV